MDEFLKMIPLGVLSAHIGARVIRKYRPDITSSDEAVALIQRAAKGIDVDATYENIDLAAVFGGLNKIITGEVK